MDSGTAALLGALIGSLSSPITTWFSDFLRHRRADRTDELRREQLRKILSLPKRKWRAVEYLAAAVGATEDKTIRLLLEIDARHSLTKSSTSWALVSRAPFPDKPVEEEEAEEDKSN
jgi:hypothetical protein